MQKLLQVRLPLEDKRDFANDCRCRGLTQKEVVQILIKRELDLIRSGRSPSYANHPETLLLQSGVE